MVASRSMLALALAGLAAAGCAKSQTVEAAIRYPAVVPVRSFPSLLVASGHLLEEVTLRHAFVDHLRGGKRLRVRPVEVDALAPARLRSGGHLYRPPDG